MKPRTLDYTIAHSKVATEIHKTASELYDSYLKYGGVDVRSHGLNTSLGCSDDHCYVLVGDRLYLFTPLNAYHIGLASEKLCLGFTTIKEEYRDSFIRFMQGQFPEINFGWGKTSPIIAENLRVQNAVEFFCKGNNIEYSKALLG